MTAATAGSSLRGGSGSRPLPPVHGARPGRRRDGRGGGPRELAAPRRAARRALSRCVASASPAVSTGPRRTPLAGPRAAPPRDQRPSTKAAGLGGSGRRGFPSSLTSRGGRVRHLAGGRPSRVPRREQTLGSGVLPGRHPPVWTEPGLRSAPRPLVPPRAGQLLTPGARCVVALSGDRPSR